VLPESTAYRRRAAASGVLHTVAPVKSKGPLRYRMERKALGRYAGTSTRTRSGASLAASDRSIAEKTAPPASDPRERMA
jgi:hypothetical protein